MDRNLTKILAAKPVVDSVIEQLKSEVNAWVKRGVVPSLKVLLVGNHPPSLIYTKNKKKFIESLGAKCEIIHLDETISKVEFLKIANEISKDSDTHGCFAQLPLPKHLNDVDVANLFPANKDVDGFHPDNINNFLSGQTNFIPGLARGIELLIKEVTPDLTDKKLCILANSDTFTETLEKYFTNQGCLTTHCHLNEPDWIEKTKQADILIVAVGKPLLIKADNIKKGAIVIDVGTNRLTDHTIVGDVDYDDVIDQCTAITPVPGGVGPMTIAMLLDNCVKLAQK